ncbi:hypothetical protein [Hymenobacter wooponensis]|uniref:Uncharacterized protein n=1 Tax=Hymenobacter wooponensis TaxID=1525360 RepID=A0A4Z0MTS2_9BACT|nr:hypothetical protein [Hymenobacter wooponensis]TGD82840.1 hypothetical protein EU557_03400 [Hymenobacter wooponensis]
MALTIEAPQTNTTPLSYGEEMKSLRSQLNGKPYCKGVKDLLPHLTPWQIRNAVNGRKEDALVLSALRIYVHKEKQALTEAQLRLEQEGAKVGLPAA